jgi:predicted negative regulator of RcsB-dependent stress response
LVLLVVGLVVGSFEWSRQRSAQLDAAAGELEELQQTVGFQDPATFEASVQGYLDRFGGTPFAIEARLLLARVHLLSEVSDPNAAAEVLAAVAPGFNSPLAVDATFMLAATLEQAERWDEAIQIYEELLAQVEFSFQTVEAGEGQARSLLAIGDSIGAVQAYQSILDSLDPDDPDRSRQQMRLAELRIQGN